MIKDWTGGNSGFYSVNHRKKEIEVEEYDFYCTHPESIKLFLKAAKNNGLVIMFMKLTFLESAKRYNFFKKYPPKYVYVYVNRQGCGKGTDNFKNGGAAAYCMYVWQKGDKNEPIIRWIN